MTSGGRRAGGLASAADPRGRSARAGAPRDDTLRGPVAKLVKCRLLALLLVVPVPPAAADPAASPADPIPLDPITVTSRRIEEDPDQVPRAISALEAADVLQGRRQIGLDEPLARVPGLFVQNPFNFAQDLRISSRGFGARANFGIRGLRMYVDGLPITLPDGQTTVEGIDLGAADRIEVMRGPSSSLYGPSAGGVIQVFTRDAPEEPFVEGRVGVGELGLERYQLGVGGRFRALRSVLSLSHLDWGGYRDLSESRSSVLNAKLRWEIDETSDLSLVLNAVDTPWAEDPGALTRDQVRRDRRQANPANRLFDAGEGLDQQRLGVVYRKSFGESHSLTVRNHYGWRDFVNRLPFQSGGTVHLERFVVGGGFQYVWTGAVRGRALRVQAGLDADAQLDDRARFDNLSGERGPRTFAQDEDVSAYGAYLQGQLALPGDLLLSAGLRLDRVRFDVDDRFRADGDDSGARTFDEPSPSVGLVWSPRAWLHLYGNVSTSFETPTTTEFANPAGGGLNPDLTSAKAANYELGAKGLLPGRLRYELAAFRVDVEDELVPFELPGQSGRSFFRNAGRSTRHGAEVSVSVEPLPGLLGTASYTYSHFTFDRYATSAGVFDGNRIPGVPDHRLFLEAAWRHDSGFYAIADAQLVGGFFADDANAVRTDSYWLSNLRLGMRLRLGRFHVEPFAGVANLFDTAYDANVRVNAFGGRFFDPAPDRNVYGGVGLGYDFAGRAAAGGANP